AEDQPPRQRSLRVLHLAGDECDVVHASAENKAPTIAPDNTSVTANGVHGAIFSTCVKLWVCVMPAQTLSMFWCSASGLEATLNPSTMSNASPRPLATVKTFCTNRPCSTPRVLMTVNKIVSATATSCPDDIVNSWRLKKVIGSSIQATGI